MTPHKPLSVNDLLIDAIERLRKQYKITTPTDTILARLTDILAKVAVKDELPDQR
jgi:hypothetical protein